MKILDKYIFKEIYYPFWISLFVFTSVLFLARSLKLFELVINRNVPVSDIILLFAYLLPRFLEMAIPMSLLISILLAFGRLSAESEIVVMRSFGVSLKRMAYPVFLYALFCVGLCLFVTLWLRPIADYRLARGLFEIAKVNASAGLTQGVFNELGNLTIYAEKIEGKGELLNNTLISDRRDEENPQTFIARYGQLLSDDLQRTLTLKLYEGSIHQGSNLTYSVTYFDTNNINIDQSELIEETTTRGKHSNEMFLSEIFAAKQELVSSQMPYPKEYYPLIAEYTIEKHLRFVIPLSCLCIAFIAMTLGIQPSRGGATWGPAASIFSGIIVILIYYLLLAVTKALGEQMIAPPHLIIWLPNLLYLIIAIILFKNVQNKGSIAFTGFIAKGVDKFQSKFKVKDS